MADYNVSYEALRQAYAGKAADCFRNLVRSCIGQSSDFYYLCMKRLDRPDFLEVMATELQVPGAYAMVHTMVESFEDIGVMPSVASFVSKFPDLKGITPDSGRSHAEVEHDAKLVEEFITRGIHARKVIEQAQDIRVNGVNETSLTSMRSMYDVEHRTQKEEKKNYLEQVKKNSEEGVYRLFVNEIDMLTQGITKGYITTIAAYTGGFKTAWAVNIALHNALEKLHTVYISLEVPQEEIWARLISAYSRIQESPIGSANAIPYQSILHFNYLTPEQQKNVEKMSEAYDRNIAPYITICDVNEVSKTDLEEEAFRQMLYGIDDQRPIDILVIDHIGLTKNYTGYAKNGIRVKDEYERINKYVAFFRDMSNAFRITDGQKRKLSVILLAQINRKGYDGAMKNVEEGGKERVKYSLTAIAEANEIERSSSFVLTIFPNKKDNTAYVQLLKNRNGQSCEEGITTTVDPAYGVFGDAVSIPTDEFQNRIKAQMQKGTSATSSTEESFDMLDSDFNLFDDSVYDY